MSGPAKNEELVKNIFGESDDSSDDEDEKPRLKKPKKDEGDAYDSGSDVEETEADKAFIDTDGDDQELLAEYAKESQNFSEDVPATDFEQQGPSLDRPTNPMDEALQKLRKKKTKEMTTDQKDKVVIQLLERMTEAAARDAEARRAGKPALAKLGMLDRVKRTFAQRTLHHTLLEFDALMVVGDWLTPNEDGSPPTLALKQGLLEAVAPLPAAPDHLKKSTIGRIVYKYSRDKRETPENRRLARKLVEQWSRPVVGKTVSYRAYQAQQEEELGASVRGSVETIDRTKDNADELIEQLEQEDPASASSSRLRVPQFTGFDFVIRPQSTVNPTNTNQRRPTVAAKADTAKSRLSKKLLKKGRR